LYAFLQCISEGAAYESKQWVMHGFHQHFVFKPPKIYVVLAKISENMRHPKTPGCFLWPFLEAFHSSKFANLLSIVGLYALVSLAGMKGGWVDEFWTTREASNVGEIQIHGPKD